MFGANKERELRVFHKTIEDTQAASDGFVKAGCPWTGKTAESMASEGEWEPEDTWGETVTEKAPELEHSEYGIVRLRSMALDLMQLADHLQGVYMKLGRVYVMSGKSQNLVAASRCEWNGVKLGHVFIVAKLTNRRTWKVGFSTDYGDVEEATV